MISDSLVKIGNIKDLRRNSANSRKVAKLSQSGFFPPELANSSTFMTEHDQFSPASIRGTRQPRVKESPESPEWSEQEVAPGLRVAVKRGGRWQAEMLDTGQVLLTKMIPKTEAKPSPKQVHSTRLAKPGNKSSVNGVSGVSVGALMRDTDGYTKLIVDPKTGKAGIW